MYRLRLLKFLIRSTGKSELNIKYVSHTTHGDNLKPVTLGAATNIIHKKYITSNHKHAPEKYARQDHLTEEEFLVRVKDDPDVFGRVEEDNDLIDEGDLKEQEYLEYKPSGKKLSTKQYADIIKDFISKRKIKEAIDVLEVRMLKEDRVKPESYIYSLLLGACGRVGYTKKAFMLYNDMKKRGLKVHSGAYTALFNACANSPWPEDGLTRAKHLREIMIEKRVEANETNYNSMIKAFGRCGDLGLAFSLVDEMVSKKIPIKEDTLNFLLQACISDKETGFRHALLVWRKFVDKNIAPNSFTYNLLLRCIRDCGLGDLETTNDVIHKILSNNQSIQLVESNEKQAPSLIEGGDKINPNLQVTWDENIKSEDVPKLLKYEYPETIKNCIENRPNLMAKNPHLGDVLQLSEVTKPEHRLLLVGGMYGFLQNMMDHKIKPDIKTFTILLDNIPSASATENELLGLMKKHDIKPDLDFYNMLIKKRASRNDYEGAQVVLDLIKKDKYRPNLITYGVLALCCTTKEEALSLLDEMQSQRYRINSEILGAMFSKASQTFNFPYVLEIMDICKRESVDIPQDFLDRIEKFYRTSKHHSNDKKGDYGGSKRFQKQFTLFRKEYKVWKLDVQPQIREEPHPWQQFRENTETDVRHYKDKEVHFKPRYLSKFKQKKIPIEIVKKPKRENKKFRKYGNLKEIGQAQVKSIEDT